MASRDPRIRAIELEASRRAALDGETSPAERFRIRQQLRREQGLGREKVKRGGLSGVWDRNKGVIGSVAGGLVSAFIPGLGAVLGPALGGIAGGSLARGKFDTSNILGDTLGGFGGASIPGVAGAIKGAFVPKAAQAGGAAMSAAPGTGALGQAGAQMANAAQMLPNVANANATLGGAAGGAVRGLGGMARSALGYIRENPQVAGLALEGVTDTMNQNANRRLRQQEIDLQRDAMEDEQERRRRIAELLAPVYQRNPGMTPTPMPQPGLPMMTGGR